MISLNIYIHFILNLKDNIRKPVGNKYKAKDYKRPNKKLNKESLRNIN